MTSAKIKKNSEINSEVIGEQFYERFRDLCFKYVCEVIMEN